MANRKAPYGVFNFLVNLGSGISETDPLLGGFSEVTGLGQEFIVAEYRNGNEKANHVRKVPGMHKISDVTCKRGIVNSQDMWAWINAMRTQGIDARRNVVITLLDESSKVVQKWKLGNVIPLKYTGPNLNGKGGTDVAMEELVLSAESIEQEQVAK